LSGAQVSMTFYPINLTFSETNFLQHCDSFKPTSIFALPFSDRFEEKELLSPLERWVRGLNQQFAKLSYALKRTGGSNPPLSAVFKRTFRQSRIRRRPRITEWFGSSIG
jgi:hypothetical protein